jgi:chromosome segregation ATPase
MERDLEYFREFLANPGSYIVQEFYEMLGEWGEYIVAHKNEFNYLEDEEWREIRERLAAAFEVKENLRLEFEELEAKLDALDDDDDSENEDEHVAVRKEWVEFIKRNQTEYGFTDEQVAECERRFEKYVQSVRKWEIAEENLRKSEIEYQKSIEELDDSLAEHFERTGKRPILTTFQLSKRFKGN